MKRFLTIFPVRPRAAWALLCLALATVLDAGPRSSGSYSIARETVDSGGGRATSDSYTHHGSMGLIAGISSAAAPEVIARHGFMGQFSDAPGLDITASLLAVNEGATVQFGATLLLDDGTLITLAPSSLTWSVLNGPLVSITQGGLATAGTVSQNTRAVVRGSYETFSGNLTLIIVNTLDDDFGTYAGDGISDSWQFQYFGENNPQAAPGTDSDGDGQDNLLEFRAGYVPVDAASFLGLRPLPLSATHLMLEVSRVQPGTRYVFERSTDLMLWTSVFTLDPPAVSAPFAQALPVSGPESYFRLRLAEP